MKRFVGLAIVCSLIIGLSISCQRPPSQVTMRTMEDADHVVAKGKGGLRFTLEQLYRSVARSKAEYNGGIYDSSRVRRHLDSLLVDSLIGLEAHQVDVRKYRQPWRTFNAQRRTVLINEFK
ncbi:hypothetical protein GF356_08635, partial [candidate division GN15 bacterium]|nr:hypothetical protein [candidate division GN15 bacterium]